VAEISFGTNPRRPSKRDAGHVVQSGRQTTSAITTSHGGLSLQWRGGLPIVPARTFASDCYSVVKRAVDIIMAVGALVALSPLLLGIALATKVTSSGPVLFRQMRSGRAGSVFQLYKFRTMRVEACDHSGVAQTTVDDERVTPLGRWLRRSSLDELPQLFNILLGDMSFVGPRPHVAGQLAAGRPYREMVAYYELRRSVRPGLTGWAQANGLRGPTDDATRARERIEHDMAYIQNASLLLDLRIILLTARDEFISGGGS
jgi:lipopolysaccharide/colanic/teichoic acid biosynthesis glycosyltransferase